MDSSCMLAGAPPDDADDERSCVLPGGRSDWRRILCVGPSLGGASDVDDVLFSTDVAFSLSNMSVRQKQPQNKSKPRVFS